MKASFIQLRAKKKHILVLTVEEQEALSPGQLKMRLDVNLFCPFKLMMQKLEELHGAFDNTYLYLYPYDCLDRVRSVVTDFNVIITTQDIYNMKLMNEPEFIDNIYQELSEKTIAEYSHDLVDMPFYLSSFTGLDPDIVKLIKPYAKLGQRVKVDKPSSVTEDSIITLPSSFVENDFQSDDQFEDKISEVTYTNLHSEKEASSSTFKDEAESPQNMSNNLNNEEIIDPKVHELINQDVIDTNLRVNRMMGNPRFHRSDDASTTCSSGNMHYDLETLSFGTSQFWNFLYKNRNSRRDMYYKKCDGSIPKWDDIVSADQLCCREDFGIPIIQYYETVFLNAPTHVVLMCVLRD